MAALCAAVIKLFAKNWEAAESAPSSGRINPRPHMGGGLDAPPGRFCALYPLFLKLEI